MNQTRILIIVRRFDITIPTSERISDFKFRLVRVSRIAMVNCEFSCMKFLKRKDILCDKIENSHWDIKKHETHISSFAIPECSLSSKISGMAVMISRWTAMSDTLIISRNLSLKSWKDCHIKCILSSLYSIIILLPSVEGFCQAIWTDWQQVLEDHIQIS